uniref:Uncharacterized protein n=1 Tax=Arundo donax TaxID=35708 RepID=A0A0A9ART4_ARUDO
MYFMQPTSRKRRTLLLVMFNFKLQTGIRITTFE